MSPLGGSLAISLAADVLAEHFGDAGELIGLALLERCDTGLRFADLIKAANSKLALPVTLNAFHSFQAKEVSGEEARDALLTLLQHEVAEMTESGCFRTTLKTVLMRLRFPAILALVGKQVSLTAVELFAEVLRHGRVKRSELVATPGSEPALDELLGKKYLRKVSPIAPPTAEVIQAPAKPSINRRVQNQPRKEAEDAGENLVLTWNLPELSLELFKEAVNDLITHRLGSEAAEVFRLACLTVRATGDRPMCDWLTADDLVQWWWATQPQNIAPAERQKLLDDKRDRIMRYLSLLSKHPDCRIFNSRVERVASAPAKRRRGAAAPAAEPEPPTEGSYRVDWKSVCSAVEGDLLQTLVLIKTGSCEGLRIYNLLRSGKRQALALDAGQISEACLIGREETQKILHALTASGLVQMQEAGAGTARGRGAPAVTGSWQYIVDSGKAREALARQLCQTTLNLRRRFRLEVQRQTRMEDRAQSLTDSERKYLEAVIQAQDVLEAQSVKSALAFTLLGDALVTK